MTVSELWVERYRSLVDLRMPLHPLTVIQGENATGKTNLYRALLLLSRGAKGELARTLLDEGGLPSALFAGEIPTRGRKPAPVRLRLGVTVDDISYELAVGLPSVEPATTPFSLDAEIKEEVAWFGPKRTRHTELLSREGATATARDVDGATATFATAIDRFEPALAQLGEPARFPELYELRARMRRWRFYHQIPTGADAPARAPRAGVRTPVLADDGRDLAAALATIEEMGHGTILSDAVGDAFPGASLEVTAIRGVFSLGLIMPRLRRPLDAHEYPIGFEALARRLDAHLLPDQREELITIACDVSRSGNVTPSFSSVLQILGGALGYSMEEIKSRLAA
jgi:predicted ATPase